MKKHILSVAILLISLIVLNGCTVAVINDDVDTEGEKEVFAVDETQEGEVKKPDDVSVVEDESKETVSSAGLPHEYTVESCEGEVTAPDGTVVATYSYSYPVFVANEGDNEEYIAEVNGIFKNSALETVKEAELEYESYKRTIENGYKWTSVNDFKYYTDIHMVEKGIISITEAWYFNYGGAHGMPFRISHTFDVVNGKELALSDLVYGDEEEIAEAFAMEFVKVSDSFYGYAPETVFAHFPEAQFYVNKDGVTAYFQPYEVAPYSEGFVSATISDKKMLKYDFSDTVNEG